MKAILFFTDDIAIVPHTATEARHLSRPVTIREFANGEPVALYELENGEYLARVGRERFIEGPEA